MNYAILRKIRAISGSRDELLVAARKVFIRSKIPNLAEAVSYFSPNDPQEFYSLYFFWALPKPSEFEPPFKSAYPDWEARRQILQQDVFELLWEQRILTTRLVASHFRLLTFPASYSLESAYKDLNYYRGLPRKKPGIEYDGLVGSWMGRRINATTTGTNESDSNSLTFLVRSDWVSLEAQQNFFDSNLRKNFDQTIEKNEIVTELASIDLRGITQSETEPAI